ncbi:MAG: hypothetical protein R3C32_13450 [Chloroflexota bacterium]
MVLGITGNGLKTLDALEDGVSLPSRSRRYQEAFESWWEGGASR